MSETSANAAAGTALEPANGSKEAATAASETEVKSTPEAPPSPSDVAAERVRQTAQWLTGAAGAVGTLLVASLGLKGVTDLEGANLVIAALGFALAISGVLAAILAMGWVLAPSRVTLSGIQNTPWLRKEIETPSSGALGGFTSVQDLIALNNEGLADRVSSQERFIELAESGADASDAKTKAEVVKAQREAATATAKRKLAAPSITRALEHASVAVILRRWHRALIIFSVAVIVTALGTFVYATQSPAEDTPDPAVAADPTPVVVNLTEAGDKAFAERLGPDCDTSSIRAIATASEDGSTDVITVDDSCAVLDLTLTDVQAGIESCPVVPAETTSTVSATTSAPVATTVVDPPPSTVSTPVTVTVPDPPELPIASAWVC